MQTMSVTCLGVGDGTPNGDRNCSAYLYDLDGERLLIDCGEPLTRSLKASGQSFDSIDRVLLSHYHFDHVGGFFMFIQGSWLEGRKRPLPVHLPAVGIEPVRQMLQAACLFEEVLPFRIQFKPIVPRRPIRLSKTRITPFLTSHLDHFRKEYEARYPGISKPTVLFWRAGDGGSVTPPTLVRPEIWMRCSSVPWISWFARWLIFSRRNSLPG